MYSNHQSNYNTYIDNEVNHTPGGSASTKRSFLGYMIMSSVQYFVSRFGVYACGVIRQFGIWACCYMHFNKGNGSGQGSVRGTHDSSS